MLLMKWAMTASWNDLDPALYDLKKDPREINNVAFKKKYKKNIAFILLVEISKEGIKKFLQMR